MKQNLKVAILLGFMTLFLVLPASAQDSTPAAESPATSTGVVNGFIFNRTLNKNVDQSMDVMLHMISQAYETVNMLHGSAETDGSFTFLDVPLVDGMLYAVMGVYEGITYYSAPIPWGDEAAILNIDLPVYETTNDLSQAVVNQMHVFFNFAQDGLEVKELYILSNLGERTITGTLTLDNSRPATIKFPLPEGAGYIFFEPNTPERFVKLQGGFADTSPLHPGEFVNQLMVSYLIPQTEQFAYTYTPPLNIQSVSLLVPLDAGVTLVSKDLGNPETTSLQDGSQYLVYSLGDLSQGQELSLSFSGDPKMDVPVAETVKSGSNNRGWAIGGAVFGLAMVGFGVWLWRRPREVDDEEGIDGVQNEAVLDDLIRQIAALDEAYERKEISENEYLPQRKILMGKAKSLAENHESPES